MNTNATIIEVMKIENILAAKNPEYWANMRGLRPKRIARTDRKPALFFILHLLVFGIVS
jgi:hypothetical protein